MAQNADYVRLLLTPAEVRIVMVALNHAILDSKDMAAKQMVINVRDRVEKQQNDSSAPLDEQAIRPGAWGFDQSDEVELHAQIDSSGS